MGGMVGGTVVGWVLSMNLGILDAELCHTDVYQCGSCCILDLYRKCNQALEIENLSRSASSVRGTFERC
jgi:hypothetical protein